MVAPSVLVGSGTRSLLNAVKILSGLGCIGVTYFAARAFWTDEFFDNETEVVTRFLAYSWIGYCLIALVTSYCLGKIAKLKAVAIIAALPLIILIVVSLYAGVGLPGHFNLYLALWFIGAVVALLLPLGLGWSIGALHGIEKSQILKRQRLSGEGGE